MIPRSLFLLFDTLAILQTFLFLQLSPASGIVLTSSLRRLRPEDAHAAAA
jgi:hypothetical protein